MTNLAASLLVNINEVSFCCIIRCLTNSCLPFPGYILSSSCPPFMSLYLPNSSLDVLGYIYWMNVQPFHIRAFRNACTLINLLESGIFVYEEIKRRISSWNVCYHVFHNLRPSIKNLSITMYRTITLSVVSYGDETWSATLKEEHRLKVFDKRVLRRTF